MAFSESIRRVGYWSVDLLRGGKVRRHYLDIKSILENETSPQASRKKEDYLRSILAYAVENVDFYKKYTGAASLADFPVVNKNIIRADYAAFQSAEYAQARVHSLHTSGSTGIPFIVRQDANKRDRVYADMMYLWGKAGYRIGMRYIFFRVWTEMNRRSRLSAWARNVVMVDLRRQDEAYFERVRGLLKSDPRIKMLLIYPGNLNDLVNYLLDHGDTPEMFHLETILGIAEAFPPSLHDRLRTLFGFSGISIYSNQENGILAVECVENKEFHVNSASYYSELLKLDSDEPVEVGEIGRIVVTDLFNHAMPLLRYDTGDTAIWKSSTDCGWKTQAFASIQGRLQDFINDTSGVSISPAAVNILMWPYDKLMQYQFIQEGEKRYVLKLNELKEHKYPDETFIKVFKGILGDDAEICIEHIHEIPVLGSGKRKYLINEYKKRGAGERAIEHDGQHNDL